MDDLFHSILKGWDLGEGLRGAEWGGQLVHCQWQPEIPHLRLFQVQASYLHHLPLRHEPFHSVASTGGEVRVIQQQQIQVISFKVEKVFVYCFYKFIGITFGSPIFGDELDLVTAKSAFAEGDPEEFSDVVTPP